MTTEEIIKSYRNITSNMDNDKGEKTMTTEEIIRNIASNMYNGKLISLRENLINVEEYIHSLICYIDDELVSRDNKTKAKNNSKGYNNFITISNVAQEIFEIYKYSPSDKVILKIPNEKGNYDFYDKVNETTFKYFIDMDIFTFFITLDDNKNYRQITINDLLIFSLNENFSYYKNSLLFIDINGKYYRISDITRDKGNVVFELSSYF